MEQTIAIALALAGSISAFWSFLMWRAAQKRKKLAPSLEDRITSLTESLKSSVAIISEIETEINKRREIVEKLSEDVSRYEQLRELNQAQVEALTQTIKSELSGESRKSLWRNAIITFAVAVGFFFLGQYIGTG